MTCPLWTRAQVVALVVQGMDDAWRSGRGSVLPYAAFEMAEAIVPTTPPAVLRKRVESWNTGVGQPSYVRWCSPYFHVSLLDMIATPDEAVETAPCGWEVEAKRFHDGQEGFRAWLREVALMFGEQAYIADDGSRMDDVLIAKVPDMVRALMAERAALKETAPCVGVRELTDAECQELYNVWCRNNDTRSATRALLARYHELLASGART